MEKEYVIDGKSFLDFEGFVKEFNKNVFGDNYWQGNLDAFNDMLYGGYGTPQIPDETEDFTIIWKNAYKSVYDLGVKELSKCLWEGDALEHIPECNLEIVKKQKALAEMGLGKTMFMLLVEIIAGHKNIKLVLN